MGRGRRAGLDSEKTAAIVAGIRLRAPLEVAAQAAGVPRSTFWDWMRRGDDGKKPYVEFSESVRRAEAEVHVLVVGSIRQAATHNPAIALRWMQMRWWQYYLEHTKVDMSIDVDKAAERVAKETGMTKEAVLEEAERIYWDDPAAWLHDRADFCDGEDPSAYQPELAWSSYVSAPARNGSKHSSRSGRLRSRPSPPGCSSARRTPRPRP